MKGRAGLQAAKADLHTAGLRVRATQLVVFPKQAMVGFQEVEELRGPFSLMKLVKLSHIVGTLLWMYLYM